MCWQYKFKSEAADYVASDNGRILYFSTFDGKLKSLNVESGLLNWQSPIGGKIVTAPVVSDGQVYVLARTAGNSNLNGTGQPTLTVHCLDRTTGITKWQTDIEPASETAENKGNDEDENFYLKAVERKLFIVTGNGEIISLDAAEGDKIQTIALPRTLSTPPFFAGDDIIFGTVERRIVSLKKNDLTKTADAKVADAPTLVIVRQNGGLVWGDRRGFVRAADVNGRTAWTFRSGGKISGLLKTPNGFLVVSDDNYIYLLSENGKLTWKKRFAERLFLMPLIVGNYAAVATDAPAEVSLIDLKTGKTGNKIVLEKEVRFNGSPLSFGGLIVLGTSEGFSAYANERCPA